MCAKQSKENKTNDTPAKIQDSADTIDGSLKEKKTQSSKKSKATGKSEVPRGMPKSKRPWKTPKAKFASIKKTVNRLTYEKKVELRNELRHIKEMSKDIKEQRKEEAVQKHKRRVENAERRLANERRSEIVQVIKNPSKLKRMKRKQMRMIEKRDLSQVKVV